MKLLNYFWSHFMKSARIRKYSGLYFPAFGLNTERYFVSLRIHSKCGKMRTRITLNTETFYAVAGFNLLMTSTAQKMKFSIKGFFSKCDQTRWNLLIQSHLLKKSLMENFIFCVVQRRVKILESKNQTLTKNSFSL